MKNFTKYLLLVSILLLFGYVVSAQKPGRPKYLLEKRGFKTLKLGDSIEKHKEYVLITEDHKTTSRSKMYKVMLDKNPTFATIGDSIKIEDIVLEVYNDLIISISIFVKDDKEAFLSSLQAAYGLGDKLSRYSQNYFWYARNKKDYIELTYLYDYPIKGPVYRNAWAIFQDKNLIAKKEYDIEKKAKQNINNL